MGHTWMLALAVGLVGAVHIVQPETAAAQDALKIGAPVSISGRYVAYGTQAKNGIEQAIEVWKKVRGDKVAGRSIEVLFRDTQSNNSIAVSLMNAFIQTDKVDVIIGPDGSNLAAAAVPPWKKIDARPIWIMPGGSSDVIEKEVGADPYFFHTYAWSYFYHDSNVKALKAGLGTAKKIALVYSDGAYGRAHVEDARKYIKESGFELITEELVREGSADFSPALIKVKARKPDILYVLVQTNDAIQLSKQIQAARMGVPYLVGTAQTQLPEWQKAVGDAQECWTGVTTWVPGLAFPADPKEPKLFPSAADWEKTWFEKYKVVPEFLEVGYYASTILALLAVEQTNSTDREKLKDALQKQSHQTPLGSSKFRPSRVAVNQAFDTMVVFQRQKKGSEYESVLVYPPEVATGKLQACN